MAFNIEELRETLNINRSDMINNRLLTNEYMIDSLMSELGYNKRKDKTVRRLSDQKIDWEVATFTGPKIGVKVFGLNEEFDDSEIEDTINYCTVKRYSVLIVTDGQYLFIYRFNKESLQYTKVCEINLSENMSDTNNTIIEAISKDTFNLNKIDELLNTKSIGYEEFIDVLNSNIDDVASILVNFITEKDTNTIEQCKIHLKKLLETTKEVIETEETDKSDIIKEKDNKIAELEKQVIKLEEQVTEIENELINSAATQDMDENTISDYVEQIRDLTLKISEQSDEIDKLNKELSEANNKLNDVSGVERKHALELLDLIEDNEELDRSYVAVINSELIQFEDLHTFVGRSLQKLYEIKSYEASQYIFNGDIFKLVQPANRNDLIMNNKAYDIDTSNTHEEDMMNKLRIVFSHFKDVVFECKKIGSIKSNHINESTNIEYESDVQYESLDNSNNGTEYIDEIDSNTIEEDASYENIDEDSSMDINEKDDSEENNDEIDISFDDEDINNTQNNRHLLCAQLQQIDYLLWNSDDTKFMNIKYIGSSSITFNINADNHIKTKEQLLCKCIDAVLALESKNGDTDIIQRFKQYNLSEASNFIKPYDEEYKTATRINGTKYIVTGLDSIQQLASTLGDICNKLNIDTYDIFIYFETVTESTEIISDWGYQDDEVQLRELTKCNVEDKADTVAIIKGNLFNNIIVTKNSLQAHKNILFKADAVRTNYMSKVLNTSDDFASAICDIVNEAYNTSGQVHISLIGNIIGEKYKLVSEVEDEVSANNIKIESNIGTLYVSEVEQWQIPHSLIKAHTALLNNAAIAIKTVVNSNAINFYNNDYETSEPSSSLAVSSFTNYIVSNIK